jgi:uroporphyrinogen decarboxylase
MPALLKALFDACMEVRMGYARNILREVGRDADIVVTADDMGTQQALQFSPTTYRKLFKPRQRKYFDLIHNLTDAPPLLHSCGSVYSILNGLVDIGVQILNPVQTHAANMDRAP